MIVYCNSNTNNTPNSDHLNSYTIQYVVQGLGGPGTFFLVGNAVRLSKGWAR